MPLTREALRSLFDDLRRHDSVLWRRVMRAVIERGPRAFVRLSPPVFGVAFGAGLARQRHAIERNLRMIHGERPRAVELVDAARVFASYASCLTDAFLAASDRGEPVRVRAASTAPFLEAQRDGRGIVLATAHAGGWQIAGLALKELLAADIVIVMRRERDPRAQLLQDQARERSGVRVAHLGDDPLDALPLLGHLRRGGVVAVQVDRLPRGLRGRKGLLFGAPFWMPEGPLRLAAVSGAPIVPVFTRRVGYMEYDVHAAAPIRLPRRPSEDELDASARAILRALEDFVRANPTQWFHFE